jgi:transposase
MDKRFRACGLDQLFLLPPSLQDWLPENHLARFIADVTNELDLSAIYAEYERKDGRGLSAYHPLLLTRVLLYGYSTGVTSSRRIERATYEDVAFRYLAADQHPDHDTIANFRREHLKALAGLFVQALRLCQKAGLVKLGNVAIDGTKIMANASTRRSVPYKKLQEREQHWAKIVADLLAAAQRTDQEEDQRYGQGQSADPLPDELAHAQSRLEKIRHAKAELEREARQQLEELERTAPTQKRGRPRKNASDAAAESDPDRVRERNKAKRQRSRARQNAASPSRQYNFVDPDSRVMLDAARKSFVQAYNAQAAADSHAQVIVAAELTQQVNDKQQLVPMTKAIQETAGGTPEAITADAGYWDTISLHDPALKGIEVLVTPDAKPQSSGAPLPRHAPNNAEALRMREVLATESGKARYRLRKMVIEPVFGQIKEARGIRRFRFRGFERASCEWKVICATHNLLKLFRHRNPPPKPKARKRGLRGEGARQGTSYRHKRPQRQYVTGCRNRHYSGFGVGPPYGKVGRFSPTGSSGRPHFPHFPETIRPFCLVLWPLQVLSAGVVRTRAKYEPIDAPMPNL